MLFIILFVYTLVAATLYILEEYKGQTWRNALFKLLASLGFVSLGVHNIVVTPEISYAWFLVSGLFLGAVGDVLLSFQPLFSMHSSKFFMGGLTAFLLGHILYIFAFMQICQMPVWALLIGSLLTLGFFLRIRQLGCKLGSMKLPVLIYILVISMMLLGAVFATAATNLFFGSFVILGAVLFLVSDFVLCLIVFTERNKPWYRWLNLSTYYLAQILLAFSIMVVN